MSTYGKEIDAILNGQVAPGTYPDHAPRTFTYGDQIDEILSTQKTPKGRVRRVIDGDTLEVEGYGRVRLRGLDTPETYGVVESGGPRATRYMKYLAEGKDVNVELLGEKDKYGRSIAHVTSADGRTSLAAEMLDAGLADRIEGLDPKRTPVKLRDGEAAAAAVKGTTASVIRGLLYPISAFVPSYYRQLDIDVLESRSTMTKFMQMKGIGDEKTRKWVSATPGVVGEMLGSFVPGVGAYGVARNLVGVAKATTFIDRAAKTLQAGAVSGTIFSAAAALDDGESRLAHIAYNTALGAAFETLGLPLLRRAWKQEVADKAAAGIINDVATRLNTDLQTADDVVTAIRTGIAPKEVTAAKAIVETIRDQHPEAVNSTVDVQAKKVLDTWMDQILPEQPPTVDPALRHQFPNYGVSFNVLVGDQRIPYHIESSKTDTAAFAKDMTAFRQQLFDWTSANDVPVKIDNVRVHSQATYSRFLNFLYGREGSGAPPLKSVPGSAVENSLAFKGDVPNPGGKAVDLATGQPVTIIAPPSSPGVGRGVQPPLETPPEGRFSGTTTDPLQRANLPAPSPSVELPAATRHATVWVEDASGKRVQKRLNELGPYLDLARTGRPILSQFKAHPDGNTRHGFIDLTQGTVHIEPVGDYSQGYYRDRYFFQQDPESQMVNMPRLFVHDGGNATIAVAPVDRVRREPYFATSLDGGPQDTIAALQHVPYNETQLQQAEAFGRSGASRRPGPPAGEGRVFLQRDPGTPNPDVVRAGGKFPAGFNPRRIRPDEEDIVGSYGQTDSFVPVTEGVKGDVHTGIPHARPSGGRRTPTRPAGYPKQSRVGEVVESEVQYGPTYQIGKDATSNPHLVTARDAARVLLRKGMSPETRINVRVTPESFSYAPEETAQWTLRELVNLEFGYTDLSDLQEEAAFRGLRAIPDGKGIILQAGDGSYSKKFSSQVEALEAVGRLPANANGPKIERELERAWGYGFERAYDASVDSDIFRPIEFMESGVKELMAGVRSLITLWSRDGNLLSESIDSLAKAARLDPSAFQVVPVLSSGTARTRQQYMVFNRTAVQQQLTRFAPALKHIGVNVKPDVLATLQDLATRKHGLAFLYGGDRDPMDALLYTFLRERGEKELWSKAEVSIDSLGPYRKFPITLRDEVKRRNLAGKAQQGNPPLGVRGLMQPLEAISEGPQGGGTWKDLADEVPLPEGFHFSPRDADAPPPMAEPQADWMLSDSSSPVSTVWNRFRIPQEMFKSLEEHTKIPFYQWYQSIEYGRGQVEALTKEPFGKLAVLARPLGREDRKRVQLLLETKHHNSESYAQMLRSSSPQIKAAAEALEGIYTDFYSKLGYSADEIRKTLGNFPQIRQSGKTYKVWTRGRAGLPKPMVDLASASDNGWAGALDTGEINLDERDLNFHTIARRMLRASANAKTLRPIWDDVDHALNVFGEARAAGTEVSVYFKYFDQYRREALHQPDDLAKSLHNFTSRSWQKLFGKKLPDDEVIDLVSTMTSFNYYANMAFQVGMVARNYLQTLQTTYPALGAKHTGEAIRWALKWRKDKALQEEMMNFGVIARDAYVEPLRDVQRLVAESNVMSSLGTLPSKAMDVLDAGVRWYQSADNFNRVVAWRGMYTKALEASNDFLEKKISWGQFIENSGAEARVEGWDTGLGVLVKDALAQGNAQKASRLLANDFATASQFLYTRGNVPYAMQSTLGRLFGQYGTWPAYYIEFFINSGFRRGSAKSRMQFLGRWAAANGAIYYGLGGMFGADMARWTFLAPTSYTGGPVAQFAQQAMAAYNQQVTGEDDPVNRIQATRMQRFATSQVLPIPVGAMRNYYRALDELGKENYDEATRRFLGLPTAESPVTGSLPPPFGR